MLRNSAGDFSKASWKRNEVPAWLWKSLLGAVGHHQDQFVSGNQVQSIGQGAVVGQSEPAKERSNGPSERVRFVVERERPD